MGDNSLIIQGRWEIVQMTIIITGGAGFIGSNFIFHIERMVCRYQSVVAQITMDHIISQKNLFH